MFIFSWLIIEEDFGHTTTKASVKLAELEQDYYFLGNKITELIKKNRESKIPLNMVITRGEKLGFERNIRKLKRGKRNFGF